MKKFQRVVLVLYCLFVAYCCVWVPWRVLFSAGDQYRAGYGLLWVGPAGDQIDPFATRPDFPIIALRVIAVTFIAGAAFLFVTLLPKPKSSTVSNPKGPAI